MCSGLSSVWALAWGATAAMEAMRPAAASSAARRRVMGVLVGVLFSMSGSSSFSRSMSFGCSVVQSIVGLKVHGLHDACPACRVFAHGLQECVAVVAHGVHTVLQQLLAHFARIDGAGELGAQLVDDGL